MATVDRCQILGTDQAAGPRAWRRAPVHPYVRLEQPSVEGDRCRVAFDQLADRPSSKRADHAFGLVVELFVIIPAMDINRPPLTADDYRDEDDLDTVPLTPPRRPSPPVLPGFAERVAGTTADGLAPAGPQRQGPSSRAASRSRRKPGRGPRGSARNSTSGPKPRRRWPPPADTTRAPRSPAHCCTASAEGASGCRPPQQRPADCRPARRSPARRSPARRLRRPQGPRTRRQSEGAPAPTIPDCCNLGVALRTIIVSNVTALVLAAAQAATGAASAERPVDGDGAETGAVRVADRSLRCQALGRMASRCNCSGSWVSPFRSW